MEFRFLMANHSEDLHSPKMDMLLAKMSLYCGVAVNSEEVPSSHSSNFYDTAYLFQSSITFTLMRLSLSHLGKIKSKRKENSKEGNIEP